MQMSDWVRLKNEFVLGNWVTLTSFFKEKGIRNNSYSRMRAHKWLQERQEYHKKILIQAQNVMVGDEVKMRRRQQQIAKQLQILGITQLKDKTVHTAEEARKLIVSGIQEERNALGLGDNELALNHPSESSYLTKFDDFVDKLSLEQVLGLIAEIKRLNGYSDDNALPVKSLTP